MRRMSCPLAAAVLLVLSLGTIASHLRAQGGAGAASLAPKQMAGTYDWGDRHYATTFTDNYEFTNHCDRGVAVTFDTRGVPFLGVMPRVTAAPGTTKIPITLTTPAWPDRPQCTDLTGVLVVQSEGYEAADAICHPVERTYTVTAHVHWWDRPAPPPKLEVAAPDACQVWWNTGERPPSASPETCLSSMRELALAYRDWLDAAIDGHPPVRWQWLPSPAAIQTMDIEALLAMKRRADAELAALAPAI